MAWKRGPLPPDTYNWGGVIPCYMEPSTGFYFADFKGDHVIAINAGEGGTKDRKLLAHEVAWYDNCLVLPGKKVPQVVGRIGSTEEAT